MKRFLSAFALMSLAAGPVLAATPDQQADLLALREQMMATVQPCDQRIGDLNEQLEALRLARADASPDRVRGAADDADRACGAANLALSGMRVPTSVDASVQAQLRTAGQKWATAMSARRRAVSVAREYLQKSDKATGQLYIKRLETAQAQIAEGAELLKAAGKAVGVEMVR